MEPNAMTTVFTSVAGSITDGLASVAPIAVPVMGAYLVWRYGVKFFKGLVK